MTFSPLLSSFPGLPIVVLVGPSLDVDPLLLCGAQSEGRSILLTSCSKSSKSSRLICFITGVGLNLSLFGSKSIWSSVNCLFEGFLCVSCSPALNVLCFFSCVRFFAFVCAFYSIFVCPYPVV